MIYIVSVLILALYLMSLPIRVKIKGGADLDKGQGKILFTVFYIPVFSASGLLESRSFLHGDVIIMQKKKKREVSVDINRKTVAEIVKIIKNLDLSPLANLDVKDINLSIKFGTDNAYATTMILGLAKILFYSLSAAIKSNQRVEIHEEFIPQYQMRTFKLDFHGIFSISIADIIYGYLRGKIKQFRLKKIANANIERSPV